MGWAAEQERADYLRDKASFCLATGVAPSEYDLMADDERDAFVDEANRRAEQD